MSRPIKFRAWSEEHNRYCDFVTLDEHGRWIGWIKSNGVFLTTIDITLEQFTGLKDKNGKEIYEGDIVEINGRWNAVGPAGYEENKCVVRWYGSTTGFEPFNNYNCDCGVYHDASVCEVIGNIHKNKKGE